MGPNWDDVPDEFEEKIRSLSEEMPVEDILSNQTAALITEAIEDPPESFSEPYESGSMAAWDITFQTGIDTDFVQWWLVALAYNQDGSPIFLVKLHGDVIERTKIGKSELPKLADGFEAADKHSMDERMKTETTSDKNKSLPLSGTSPKKITETEWEYVVNEEAAKKNEQTFVIRRAPALDSESLGTYVLEKRNVSKSSDSPVSIGAFWGHHGLRFAERMRDAASWYN